MSAQSLTYEIRDCAQVVVMLALSGAPRYAVRGLRGSVGCVADNAAAEAGLEHYAAALAPAAERSFACRPGTGSPGRLLPDSHDSLG